MLPSVYNISNDLPSPSQLSGLLARAKQGQDSALGEIYNLYFQKIYRFVFYRVGHKELAEDLAEEVFLKAFSKLGSLEKESSLEGWLYQIARNLVIDYYRQKKLTISLDEVENTLEYESNLIDVVNLQQQQKILLKALKHLTTEQQIVIKLKFFEDLDNGEIAELLHKTEGAIRVIQHRALNQLSQLLQNYKHDQD